MKTMSFIAVVFLFTFGTSAAETQQPAVVNPKVSWMPDFGSANVSLTSSVRSKFVNGVGHELYEDAIFQENLFIKLENGLAFDLMLTAPASLDEFNENNATELDLTVGWTGKIDAYNVSFGMTYFDFVDVGTPNDYDVFFPYLDVGHDFKPTPDLTLTPFFRLEPRFTGDGVLQGDLVARVGSRYGWKINDHATLSGRVMLSYDPGLRGGDTAWIGGADAALQWKIGNHLIVEMPSIKVMGPLNDPDDSRETEVIVGAGFTLKF